MIDQFIGFVVLILIILALVLLANKLRIAYPIILVLGGLLISFTSLFPDVTIDPELVFFIFLPPLLYEAAWQTSWKEFWKWRRVITSFAFPIVILTASVIAYISHWIIPGFTLALGFLLGGIISPPDAISATTIMRKVNAPKSLVNIIEGESLLNDASSLIILRFALVAVITGQFNFGQASLNFVVVVVMGVLIGVALAFILFIIHRSLPIDTNIEVALTLVTPYCMYYAAEYFHFSGVLAVVSGGLFLSSKRQTMLSYRSRIEGVNVWTNFVFLLNGSIFLLIGLQLPSITAQLEGISIPKAIGYGLAISFVLIITRLLCTFGAALFTRIMGKIITVADPNPGWKTPLIAGWAGMRGVVSLAAALSIPLLAAQGHPFPYRNLILFITFIVILVTLVFQGITLPWLIRKVKPEDKFQVMDEQSQEMIIQNKIALFSLKYLKDNYSEEKANTMLTNLIAKLQIELDFFHAAADVNTPTDVDTENARNAFRIIYLQMLDEQRKLLGLMNQRTEFDEDLIRKYLSLIDMEEHKIREKHTIIEA
jgi:monovalent cation/hydrogen antiporter